MSTEVGYGTSYFTYKAIDTVEEIGNDHVDGRLRRRRLKKRKIRPTPWYSLDWNGYCFLWLLFLTFLGLLYVSLRISKTPRVVQFQTTATTTVGGGPGLNFTTLPSSHLSSATLAEFTTNSNIEPTITTSQGGGVTPTVTIEPLTIFSTTTKTNTINPTSTTNLGATTTTTISFFTSIETGQSSTPTSEPSPSIISTFTSSPSPSSFTYSSPSSFTSSPPSSFTSSPPSSFTSSPSPSPSPNPVPLECSSHGPFNPKLSDREGSLTGLDVIGISTTAIILEFLVPVFWYNISFNLYPLVQNHSDCPALEVTNNSNINSFIVNGSWATFDEGFSYYMDVTDNQNLLAHSHEPINQTNTSQPSFPECVKIYLFILPLSSCPLQESTYSLNGTELDYTEVLARVSLTAQWLRLFMGLESIAQENRLFDVTVTFINTGGGTNNGTVVIVPNVNSTINISSLTLGIIILPDYLNLQRFYAKISYLTAVPAGLPLEVGEAETAIGTIVPGSTQFLLLAAEPTCEISAFGTPNEVCIQTHRVDFTLNQCNAASAQFNARHLFEETAITTGNMGAYPPGEIIITLEPQELCQQRIDSISIQTDIFITGLEETTQWLLLNFGYNPIVDAIPAPPNSYTLIEANNTNSSLISLVQNLTFCFVIRIVPVTSTGVELLDVDIDIFIEQLTTTIIPLDVGLNGTFQVIYQTQDLFFFPANNTNNTNQTAEAQCCPPHYTAFCYEQEYDLEQQVTVIHDIKARVVYTSLGASNDTSINHNITTRRRTLMENQNEVTNDITNRWHTMDVNNAMLEVTIPLGMNLPTNSLPMDSEKDMGSASSWTHFISPSHDDQANPPKLQKHDDDLNTLLNSDIFIPLIIVALVIGCCTVIPAAIYYERHNDVNKFSNSEILRHFNTISRLEEERDEKNAIHIKKNTPPLPYTIGSLSHKNQTNPWNNEASQPKDPFNLYDTSTEIKGTRSAHRTHVDFPTQNQQMRSDSSDIRTTDEVLGFAERLGLLWAYEKIIEL